MTIDPQHAQNLYDQAVVIDALNVSNWDSDAVFESLNAGSVAAINATQATWEGYEETLDMIAKWYVRFRQRPEQILLVETVDDIHRAKREGKTGIIFGWQNTSPIENDLDRSNCFTNSASASCRSPTMSATCSATDAWSDKTAASPTSASMP